MIDAHFFFNFEVFSFLFYAENFFFLFPKFGAKLNDFLQFFDDDEDSAPC